MRDHGHGGRPRAIDLLTDLQHNWRKQAACRGLDPNLFFPEQGSTGVKGAIEAKAVCARCPVRAQCLNYAIQTKEKYGIWGGVAITGRRQIARTKRDRKLIQMIDGSDSSTQHSEQTGVQK